MEININATRERHGWLSEAARRQLRGSLAVVDLLKLDLCSITAILRALAASSRPLTKSQVRDVCGRRRDNFIYKPRDVADVRGRKKKTSKRSREVKKTYTLSLMHQRTSRNSFRVLYPVRFCPRFLSHRESCMSQTYMQAIVRFIPVESDGNLDYFDLRSC